MPAKKHGLKNSPEYQAWRGAKTRCYNPNRKDFMNYGKRGIYVCDRWLNSFENFYQDMGPRPSNKHSLERINNDLGYSPDNCRWVEYEVQANNKRNNTKHTFRGQTLSLPQWAKVIGIKRSTLSQRIYSYKWSIEKTLTTPVRKQGKTSKPLV